ncbi:hypothetical protein BO70DRAFT_425974 [Aspergillus heteromorphus CBS 117.55]|uniref:Protein-lysine N-methyltransferase EFM4 n=1 Tax=Aspergillus heteromorphus CBS 117.55 TaxID=1448321 RepID=A0A317WXE3_9EURO|nr:uncharacterized protein BO70DRAFT_425974 [Aspergillus heteromorphus CBS 117.55]PWY91064.1 hypothetical protein BO70DRAFT_425974 [Aspergillus heteromorphus CBS 117.55]
MAEHSHPTHLSPSELGTKDYWETFYARTLSHISTKHNSSSTTTTTTTTKPSHKDASPSSGNESDDEEEEEEEENDEVDDDSDPGTSWFSEHNAPDKVLRFLTDESFPLAPCNTHPTSNPNSNPNPNPSNDNDNNEKKEDTQSQPCILDLGTGNGSMLALLRKRGGYTGDMVGVDYSARSVLLARELQRLRIHSAYLSDSDDDSESDSDAEGQDRGEDESKGEEKKAEDTNIRFEEWDILHSDNTTTTTTTSNEKPDWFPHAKGGFDIVLDKGTFDAVSLSDEVVEDQGKSGETGAASASGKKIQRRVCERYPGIVRGLVRRGGFVVVTSCNWTEEELVSWFTNSESGDGDQSGDRGLN